LVRILLAMNERTHKRLLVEFIEEYLLLSILFGTANWRLWVF